MSQPAKVEEPSMEEILASIRRIIADDDASKTVKALEPVAPKSPVVTAVPSRPAPPHPPPPVAAPAPATKPIDIDAILGDLDKPKIAPNIEPPAPSPSNDVLDLTEAMTTPSSAPAPTFLSIDDDSDVKFSDRPVEAPLPIPPVQAPMTETGLISSATAAAVDSAFNTLAHTVIGQNARTLEDLVKEMLRPMLKSWLDDNLPGLVERIVRAEIERVSRGKP